MRRGERAQATVELAFVLPAVVVVVLAVAQVLMVARDATALTAATRAGARAAMVGEPIAAIRSAALRERRLVGERLVITHDRALTSGALVTVEATYRSRTDVPIVGRFVGDVELRENFVIQVE